MGTTSYRLAVFEDGEWHPHAYPDVFGWEEPYLVAAPSRAPLALATELLEVMTPPFQIEAEVLEAIGLPITEGATIALLCGASREEAGAFLRRNSEILESDARLAVIIHGSAGERIVYDEHNRLLLTGSVVDFEGILISAGLLPGEVSVPMPHVHQYRDDLTPALARLLAA